MADQFVEQGKVVSFSYSISDESGEILEQSDIPVNYVHGGRHDLFEKVVADACHRNKWSGFSNVEKNHHQK